LYTSGSIKVVSCRDWAAWASCPFRAIILYRFLEASACCCLLAASFSIAALKLSLNSKFCSSPLDLFAHSIKLFLTILAHLQNLFPWAFSICFNFSS
jgi:hypothetical protein